jgi:prepilin-type N-terminal cleavage/methylation domain-containing protein
MDKKYCSIFTKGFTLIELLLVIAIVGLLAVIIFISFPDQINKGFDRRRKHDLTRIKTGFEEYYSDNGCYPPESIMDVCGDGAAGLQPYLSFIPCDPKSKEPYGVRVEDSDCPQWFKIYASLQYEQDSIINELGCLNGCGPDNNDDGVSDYNYGVHSTNVSLSDIATGTCSGFYYVWDCTPGDDGFCGEGEDKRLPQCNVRPSKPSCSPYFCSDCGTPVERCL